MKLVYWSGAVNQISAAREKVHGSRGAELNGGAVAGGCLFKKPTSWPLVQKLWLFLSPDGKVETGTCVPASNLFPGFLQNSKGNNVMNGFLQELREVLPKLIQRH